MHPMFIDGWMDKQAMVHTYNGMLFSLKKEGFCHMLQHGQTLRTSCWETYSRYRKTYTVWFHLHEVSKVAKFIETESRVSGAGVRRAKGTSLMCTEFPICKMKNWGDMFYNNLKIFNTYWSKHLKLVKTVNARFFTTLQKTLKMKKKKTIIDNRKVGYCACLGVPGGRIIESICTLKVGLIVFFFSFLLTMIGYYQTKISRENLFKKKERMSCLTGF